MLKTNRFWTSRKRLRRSLKVVLTIPNSKAIGCGLDVRPNCSGIEAVGSEAATTKFCGDVCLHTFTYENWSSRIIHDTIRDAKMHRLALTPTSFIGRSQELDEISPLQDDPSCRLLTLVGSGGIGKTRLAVEVASHKRDVFPDGRFFVPLAPLNRADDILTAIAAAMPFCFQQDNRSLHEQFFAYLSEKHAQRVLLVMDNFEHLLDGVDIVSEILATTTSLKILVTSREVLNLQEEWVRQITGLAYPNREDGEPIADYSAVQLFMDRARRVRGDFDLAEGSGSVVEICRLVEGMPLAIELAVGWLKTLSPADIAHEIRHNFDILANRSRNLPERHPSIRSVFSPSLRLMPENGSDGFQKLSVFRGGFTREAAEGVAGASLPPLAGLVD